MAGQKSGRGEAFEVKPLILIDAHVHVYDCFNMDQFLSAAYNNFAVAAKRDFDTQSFSGVLLLTETSRDQWFEKCAQIAKKIDHPVEETWRFTNTEEDCALVAKSGQKALFIIAGRQVVTAENLEVLALFSRNTYADGQPIDEVLDTVKKCGAISVIPWGAGKWFGKRGHILDQLLKNRSNMFLLGDNGGRPTFWGIPRHFKTARAIGLRILPGTDPLPFSDELARVATFGAAFEAVMSAKKPATTLKTLIGSSDKILFPYGGLESPLRFFKNQVSMQVVKRQRERVST